MRACEIRYKQLTGPLRLAVVCGILTIGLAGPVAAGQPDQAPPTAEGAADATPEEASHDGGMVDFVARLLNFGILAGALVYLLRGPVTKYLGDRQDQLRSDLVNAAQMRKTANEQLANIEQQLAALPSEIENLRTQGTSEIAAEEARIAKVAETERERLLEQTRREMDRQVLVVLRDLRVEAAELATSIATTRISQTMTDNDQQRLMDRYLTQLDATGAGSDTKVAP